MCPAAEAEARIESELTHSSAVMPALGMTPPAALSFFDSSVKKSPASEMRNLTPSLGPTTRRFFILNMHDSMMMCSWYSSMYAAISGVASRGAGGEGVSPVNEA